MTPPHLLSCAQVQSTVPVAFSSLQMLVLHPRNPYSPAFCPLKALLVPGLLQVRSTIPVAFSALQMLVLYPGNPYICGLPNANTGGRTFVDVAGGALLLGPGECNAQLQGLRPGVRSCWGHSTAALC